VTELGREERGENKEEGENKGGERGKGEIKKGETSGEGETGNLGRGEGREGEVGGIYFTLLHFTVIKYCMFYLTLLHTIGLPTLDR
jgi:hypothetical protein